MKHLFLLVWLYNEGIFTWTAAPSVPTQSPVQV